MPNWCEGWVKFRGSLDDLKCFIENEFKGAEPKNNNGELSPCLENRSTLLNSLVRTYIDHNDTPEANEEVFCDSNGVGIFVIKLCHAWNVDRQGYEELAKKYNLDIKGKCYERGMEFVEEFEVNNKGEVVLYEVHEFDNYCWECECPTLGG